MHVIGHLLSNNESTNLFIFYSVSYNHLYCVVGSEYLFYKLQFLNDIKIENRLRNKK